MRFNVMIVSPAIVFRGAMKKSGLKEMESGLPA